MSTSRGRNINNQTLENTGIYYADTATPLAANATFTGSSRTMSAGNNFFNASFYTDTNSAASGASIESSSDASVWLPEPVPATVTAQQVLACKRTTAYYRVKLTQSATPAGTLRITSSQTPN